MLIRPFVKMVKSFGHIFVYTNGVPGSLNVDRQGVSLYYQRQVFFLKFVNKYESCIHYRFLSFIGSIGNCQLTYLIMYINVTL